MNIQSNIVKVLEHHPVVCDGTQWYIQAYVEDQSTCLSLSKVVPHMCKYHRITES